MSTDKSNYTIPAIYLLMNVLFIPIFLLFRIFLKNYMLEDSITQLAFYFPAYLLLIVLYVAFWKQAFKDAFSRKMEILILILKGFGLMIVAMIFLNYIYELLQIIDTSSNQEYLDNLAINGTIYDIINLAVFTVIFAPLVEEMVFRKALFGILGSKNVLPINVVITISAFIFGLMHTGFTDLVQIFYYAGMGAVLGYIYYRSNNIIVPITVHMLYNLWGVIGMLLLYT